MSSLEKKLKQKSIQQLQIQHEIKISFEFFSIHFICGKALVGSEKPHRTFIDLINGIDIDPNLECSPIFLSSVNSIEKCFDV